ncbi:hypothetical protein Salat_1370300 [Sesamum alatum]|uniref:Uncharacterized protein n=1 Tax=Sesamum alatum TaxID=300844 RepID=A0AAE2CL10_9LAMI|nr:hypothetical protein Salat_1370300 [Sesamum alatum]
MANTSVRSDVGLAPLPEMVPPSFNSAEFPPLRTQPARVNSAEPTQPPAEQNLNMQKSSLNQAVPNLTEAHPQAHKSFVDVVNSQSSDSSFPMSIQHSYLAGVPPAKTCYTKGNAPKPQRFQQQKGKAAVAPRRHERGGQNAENVIFEIEEPSNSKTDNQRRKNVVVAAGIESNNKFAALNQVEGEDERGGANQHAENFQAARNTRYHAEPLNQVMQIFTENDGSPTPQTHIEIATPAFKPNACNVGIDADHTCDVAEVNLHNVSAINEPCDAENNDNRLHVTTNEEYEAVINVNDTGIDVNDVSNVDLMCYRAADVVDNCNNICELSDKNVVGHCEGVAMEAPLQCVVLVPCPPHPVAVSSQQNNRVEGKSEQSRTQLQICNINEAAAECPSNDSFELDGELDEGEENELVSQPAPVQPASTQLYLEDAVVRGKHRRTQSSGDIFQQNRSISPPASGNKNSDSDTE